MDDFKNRKISNIPTIKKKVRITYVSTHDFQKITPLRNNEWVPHQHRPRRISMKPNYNKKNRRLGVIKQPGGSSCNQRR